VVLLNRQDLAEQAATQRWLDALGLVGIKAFSTTATRAGTLRAVRTTLRAFPGRSTRIRAAVVGAPNTGKSSVINALASRKKAARENRAGVTRHVNWISLDEGVDLLDTPGVLEPRITDPARAWQLALCGILPESAFDVEEVAVCFADWTAGHGRDANRTLDLNSFARRRGMLRNRGEIDRRNAARALLTSFREGRLGRYTLELPGDHQ